MPSGKVHIRYWKYVLPISCIISLILMFYSFWFGIMFLLGYLLGYICDPDLDQISITSAEGRALRKFGFLGVLWIMYWMPYGYVLKHRSILSHSLVLSTIIRVLYLLMIPITLNLLGYIEIGWSSVVVQMIPVVLGLMMSDAVHIVLDRR